MQTTASVDLQLTYRLFQPGDEDDILRLWAEDSGWGSITMQQFRKWFLESPYGECLIVVAADGDNKVRGQLVYAHARVIVNGKILHAAKGAAPILDGRLRSGHLRSAGHPAFQLIKKGLELLADAGVQLVYSFPAYGWLGLFQQFPRMLPNPTDATSFGCVAIPLAQTGNSKRQSMLVEQIDAFDETHEQLWRQAVTTLQVQCAIHREPKWTNWVMAKQIKLQVKSTVDGSLLGYIAIKPESGLINDFVTKNADDAHTALGAVLHYLQHNNVLSSLLPGRLKAMCTPHMQQALEGFEVEEDEFRFAFGVYLTDTKLDRTIADTNNWYLTPLG